MITASYAVEQRNNTYLAAIAQKEGLFAVQRAVRSPFRLTITLYLGTVIGAPSPTSQDRTQEVLDQGLIRSRIFS